MAELLSLDDLKGQNESYWQRFVQARHEGHLWRKGCEILLNIEHRLTAQKMKRASDPLTLITDDPSEDDDIDECCSRTKAKKSRCKVDDGTEVTLAHFDEDFERLIDDDYRIMEGYDDNTQRTNNHLVERASVNNEKRAISARVRHTSSVLCSNANDSGRANDSTSKKKKK